MRWEQGKPRDNVLAGTFGAFLGSLIGVSFIVLGNWLGYVTIASGVVMSLCTTKGYALLGGRLGKRGAVISALLIIVMTYFANDLCAALEIMEALGDVSFFAAYRDIDVYLEAKVIDGHWGRLFCLYFLTLLGSVPVVFGALPKPVPAAGRPRPAAEQDRPDLQGTFYTMRKDWMRPLRLSVLAPLLAVIAAVAAGFLLTAFFRESRLSTAVALGGFVSAVVLFFLDIPAIRLCNSFQFLYVRAGGKLWRVNLQIFCNVMDWEAQPPDRQAAIKADILQEIQCLLDAEAPSYGPGALVELKNLRVEKETRWGWKTSYETGTGRRKKLAIGKGYPDFVPERGLERPQGPVPAHWTAAVLSIVFAAAVMGVYWAVDLPADLMRAVAARSPALETDAEPEPERIPARVPEFYTEYEMSEVWFRVDAQFQVGRRTFLDGETGTLYRVYVQYGVDADDAWDTLTRFLGEYHASPLFERFETACLEEGLLAPLDQSSGYNIVSVYLTDGRVFHTAAVLSDDGTLFTMEASHDCASQGAEDVLANLMYTLKSVRFGGPAVTQENYQAQIHVSEARDCEFMAAAYLKTDIFGHDALVDVYVPYSAQPIYAGDGRAVRSEAHGLRVYVTILPGESAMDVIDAQQQAMAASGRAYGQDVEEEQYWEDSDVAYRQVVYEENGQTRYAILYADPKWEGYYLFREFTCLPELVDGDYAAELAELERLSGLTMPPLKAVGGA